MTEIEINQIHGFHIGQAQNEAAATGCTIIICKDGAVCGADVRGGSPVTRDTDALSPLCNREKVHAVMFAGGSSFGLSAADGAVRFLEERGIGRDVGVTVVPNVCAAVLYDLKYGDSKIRPDAAMGYAACENAYKNMPFQSGSFGAGTGATVGTIGGTEHAMKGGIGAAALRYGSLEVGAIVAVNCVGDVFDSESGEVIAGMRSHDGGFYGAERYALEHYRESTDLFSGHTILGCIITNAKLTKPQAAKLSSIAHNGIARAVRPAHTIFDGDVIFSMCTGTVEATLDAVGVLAAKTVERAIINAVQNAKAMY